MKAIIYNKISLLVPGIMLVCGHCSDAKDNEIPLHGRVISKELMYYVYDNKVYNRYAAEIRIAKEGGGFDNKKIKEISAVYAIRFKLAESVASQGLKFKYGQVLNCFVVDNASIANGHTSEMKFPLKAFGPGESLLNSLVDISVVKRDEIVMKGGGKSLTFKIISAKWYEPR